MTPRHSYYKLANVLYRHSMNVKFYPIIIRYLLNFLMFFLFYFRKNTCKDGSELRVFVFTGQFCFLSTRKTDVPSSGPKTYFLYPLFCNFLLLIMRNTSIVVAYFLTIRYHLRRSMLLLTHLRFNIRDLFIFLYLIRYPFHFDRWERNTRYLRRILPSNVRFIFLILRNETIRNFGLLIPRICFILRYVILLFFPNRNDFLINALLSFCKLLHNGSFGIHIMNTSTYLNVRYKF